MVCTLFQVYGHLIGKTFLQQLKRMWVRFPSINLTLKLLKMNILLNEDDFTKLTKGEIIKRNDNGQEINIALQDIGYIRLIEIINQNYSNFINKNL